MTKNPLCALFLRSSTVLRDPKKPQNQVSAQTLLLLALLIAGTVIALFTVATGGTLDTRATFTPFDTPVDLQVQIKGVPRHNSGP